jgi:hypothetical protein
MVKLSAYMQRIVFELRAGEDDDILDWLHDPAQGRRRVVDIGKAALRALIANESKTKKGGK